MQARHELVGEVDVIYLSGRLNLDACETFKEVCLSKFANTKIIFCMQDLSFVGSTGITIFLETMRELRLNIAQPIKFCNVSSEYKKIFAANLFGHYEDFETLELAARSFQNPYASVLQSDMWSESQQQPQQSPVLHSAPAGAVAQPIFGVTQNQEIQVEPQVQAPVTSEELVVAPVTPQVIDESNN